MCQPEYLIGEIMPVLIGSGKERKKIDDFMATHPSSNFRQTFAWGQIKSMAGWEPIYLYVENNNRIEAAILIFKKKIPILGKSIFYGCRGPVVDWNNLDALNQLIEGVIEIAVSHNSIFLRIDPEPEDESLIKDRLLNLDFITKEYAFTSWNRTRYEIRVMLDESEDELFKRIRRTTRQNINSGYRKGITVDISYNEGDERRFYELLCQLEKEKKAINHDADYYKKVLNEIIVKGKGDLIKAVYNDTIVSAMILSYVGDRCWAVYMANDYNFRKLMPNKIVMWEGIKLAKKRGCRFFDMGATQGSSFDRNSNLDSYKMSFKPEIVKFPEYYDLPFTPFLYKIFTMTEVKLVPLIYKLKTIISRN